ncbi:MAG: DNA-3-methyladenine glycosylase [Phycisphaeraceae bacterium]|nr:DNA-3-methyladenine glycosylase [Phycisphaeraceae bacterium]
MRGAARFDRWHLGARALARALLGQVLVRVDRSRRFSGRIVETEAYLGAMDLGSHTAGGRRTPRTESMYRAGGHTYVYFVYGMHHCLNVVAAPEGVGCAVLIRAIEPLEGFDQSTGAPRRCAGPARLCRALLIDRSFDGEDLRTSRRLFIERGRAVAPARIVVGPRIGIDSAGAWRDAPLRFGVAGSQALSRPFPEKFSASGGSAAGAKSWSSRRWPA